MNFTLKKAFFWLVAILFVIDVLAVSWENGSIPFFGAIYPSCSSSGMC